MPDTNEFEFDVLTEALKKFIANYGEENLPAGFIDLTKSFQSNNITIQNWNTLVVQIQQSVSNTNTCKEFLVTLTEFVKGYLSNTYTTEQIDELLSLKANITNVYTKSETYNRSDSNAKFAIKNENNSFTGDNTFASNPPIILMNIGMQQVIDPKWAVNKEYVDDLLDDKQDKLVSGNNIKTINNESILGSGNINVQASSSWGDIGGNINNQTDLQNEFQDVREVAEGKNKSIVISYALDIETIKRFIGYGGTAILPDGTDITTNVLNGEYDNLIKNSLFNSSSSEIRFEGNENPGYIVEERTNEMSLRNVYVFYNTSTFPTLKQGDIIFVIETDVPDRWISLTGYPYISLYKLETTKVDLSGYAQLSGNNTWTGTNTFNDVKIETLVVGKFNDPNSDAYFQIGNGRSDYLHNVISIEKNGIWVGGGNTAVNRWITWDKIREVTDNINNDNFVLKASLLASDGDINDIFTEE